MKYTFLLVTSLFTMSCSATSCLVTDELISKNSADNANKIDIKVSATGTLLNVVLTVPAEIDRLKFNGIMVHKEKSKQNLGEFVMPLNTYVEDDKILAWYTIDKKSASDNYLTIDYGEDCGISLKYKVN